MDERIRRAERDGTGGRSECRVSGCDYEQWEDSNAGHTVIYIGGERIAVPWFEQSIRDPNKRLLEAVRDRFKGQEVVCARCKHPYDIEAIWTTG